MNSNLKDKRIFVTGACGTIGRELVRQLLENYGVSELVGIDNNESELFFLEQEFSNHKNARFFLADVRDKSKLVRQMKHMQIIFHTAAYKHVILCERSPFEAIQTNILGVQNVINSANENNVEKVIFTSSDKAVNPTNVMGTSKLMGERLMTAANSNRRGRGPIFASTRFGNILGSRGSVLPIFVEQIRKGGPVTITDPRMTRFIMSIDEGVHLVINSANLACGGEIFITKMPVIRIQDLAEILIQELASKFGHSPGDIRIENIGVKPGEKMYEELMNIEETRRAWELDKYYAVLPAYGNIYENIPYEFPKILRKNIEKTYNSENEPPLTVHELKHFLTDNELLYEILGIPDHPSERYWP
jgi:FlaA1/EpsC-like NDP-sugar epimerase